MENKFRFYLQDNTGKYYFMNGNVVDLTTTKTPLIYAPQNWDVTELNWERGFKYHGIVRKTSTTFEFHKDSASILRSVYYNGGVNAYAKFVIERFNDTFAVQNYELLYDGEINFVSYKSTLYGVQCEIIEGGFLNKLGSREDTNYDIDLYTNPNQIWVKMDGINLQFLFNWLSPSGQNVPVTFYKRYIPQFSGGLGEGTNKSVRIYDQFFAVGVVQPVKLIENDTLGVVNFDLTFDYNYNIYTPSHDVYFEIGYEKYQPSSGGTISNVVVYQDPNLILTGTSTTKIGSVTVNITLNPNEGVYNEITLRRTNGSLDANPTLTQIKSKIHLSLNSRTPTTYIKCLRTSYVFDELINKISDGNTNSDSQLLDANEDKVITSFDSIRNLPNSKLNTNFKDFYESMNNIFNTCLIYDKINNYCYLEPKVNVYDNSISVLNLGEISELEIIPHKEDLFSNLKASYNSYDYDSVNGKDEFNTLNEFLSPLTAVSTELDLSNTYRADMYGIELTRLNLTGKTVTDGENDNDVAVIHIENTIAGQIPVGNPGAGQDYYEIYRDNTLTITNIYSPQTAYNIFFSPKRCLFRQGNYLRSLMYGNDSELIKYQISSKNNYLGLKMVTNDGTTIIDEGADILISTLDNIIFKPTLFEFKTKVNNSLDLIMNATPYKLCSFTFKNNTYYGFFIKSSLQPAFNEAQTFTLLCAPQTDLTNLIY